MICVVALTGQHRDAVAAIHLAGIETGNATFATEPLSWPEFDAAKLAEHRFVALDDGAVVGWVAVAATSDRTVYAGVVEDALYVAPGHSGRGIGRQLLAACIASTEAAGIWTIQAGIFPENLASLRVHRALGFRVVGTASRKGLMRSGPWAGQWRDVVLLERRSETAGR